MSAELERLRRLVSHGLAQTACMWLPIRLLYSWVHRAARILANAEDLCAEELRRDYRQLLQEMSSGTEELGELTGAVSLFLKVTKSYWKWLFQCYRYPDLPRTNNDLEHCFGSVRYGERRASGRKGASPALVVRGSVRLVAAMATPPEGFCATDIRSTPMFKDGGLFERRSIRGERAGEPSYVFGGTRKPTSAN